MATPQPQPQPQPQTATLNQLRAEQLVEKIFNDPEFADLAPAIHKAATKLFGPEIKDPAAVSIRKTVEPEVAALRKLLEQSDEKLAKVVERLEARDKADEEAKVLRGMQDQVDGAVREFGFTEEGKSKLIDYMRDNKVYDARAAAAVLAHDAPPAPTSGPSWAPRKANFYGTSEADDAFKRLHTDPQGFMDEEIGRFLRNPDAYAAEAA